MFLIVLSLVIVSMFIVGCQENFAGEAVKTRIVEKQAPADLKTQGNCKYVDFPKINNDWSGQTYKQICASQGGMSCTAVDVKEITYVFENSLCTPPTRWRTENNVLHPELCDAGIYWQDLISLSGEETCVEGSSSPGFVNSAEYYKSKKEFVNLDGVLCCS